MSDAAFRAAIKTLFEEIPGVGKVHAYERFAKEPSKFLEFFKNSDSKIYGWEITRSAVSASEWITKKCKLTHLYVIKGYYGLRDAQASDGAFGAIIDAILLKFISKKVTGSSLHKLPIVPTIHVREFASVLCHYAEIHLQVTEIVAQVSDEELVDLLKIDLQYFLGEATQGSDLVGEEGGQLEGVGTILTA
ncbi:MAG: hypothetical protein NTY64_15120, partial [Deltaproteobacteria bacterium]|nr:hypothetical protein [Deltaproteobacteria bacterium]